MRILKNRLLVRYVTSETVYGSEDHFVWKSSDYGKTWRKICELQPAGSGLAARLRSSLLRTGVIRFFRKNLGISNVVVLPTGTVICQYDKVYRYDGVGRIAKPVFDLAAESVAPPLINGMCFDDETNSIYFGEYICERPAEIGIYKGDMDGKVWQECYRFPKGAIRHVHSIIPDSFRKRLWICTGDSDDESGLYYTDDGFKTVELFAGGDQSWRMVSLIPTEDAIYWGSDAGGDAPAGVKNAVYRYVFSSKKRETLMEMDNPIYFSMKTPNGLLMSTTYEPHKEGALPAAAELLFSEDGVSWDSVCSFPYRRPSSGYCTSYGMLLLPRGDCCQPIFSPINTVTCHFSILALDKSSRDAWDS